MTNEQQPEPLRIAALLEKTGAQGSLRDEAASELLRQYAELETLRTGYAAARLEVESLKAQLAERASHGQAPAQAVPAAVAGPSGPSERALCSALTDQGENNESKTA
jgi:hypothetical protein